MDDELFESVYRIACQLWPRREKRVPFSGQLIVLMYCGSVIRGKPRWWVCDRRNLPKRLADVPTPSRSQFGRRFNSVAVGRIGLDHLPGFVRTLPRVRRWIQAKLTLYAITQQKNLRR